MITEYSPHLERFLIDNNELNSPKTKFYSINCELINRSRNKFIGNCVVFPRHSILTLKGQHMQWLK